MRPYISGHGKMLKWLMGTAGFAILCAILAGIMDASLKG